MPTPPSPTERENHPNGQQGPAKSPELELCSLITIYRPGFRTAVNRPPRTPQRPIILPHTNRVRVPQQRRIRPAPPARSVPSFVWLLENRADLLSFRAELVSPGQSARSRPWVQQIYFNDVHKIARRMRGNHRRNGGDHARSKPYHVVSTL